MLKPLNLMGPMIDMIFQNTCGLIGHLVGDFLMVKVEIKKSALLTSRSGGISISKSIECNPQQATLISGLYLYVCSLNFIIHLPESFGYFGIGSPIQFPSFHRFPYSERRMRQSKSSTKIVSKQDSNVPKQTWNQQIGMSFRIVLGMFTSNFVPVTRFTLDLARRYFRF